MTFISYAQNYEDVTLLRALGHVEQGFYIDVGAHDPVVDSVTKAFLREGLARHQHRTDRRVAREADRRPARRHQPACRDRRRGRCGSLHEVVGTGMTTASAEFAALHDASGFEVRDVRVAAITLDTVWTDCGVKEVHFLKVDVEGAEGDVLRGLSLDVHRPWVILLEATLPNSMEPCHAEWEPLLTDRGYTFVYFDGLNRFYVADEHLAALRPALSLPPNFFDPFERYADHMARQQLAGASSERDAVAAERDAVAAERDAMTADRDALVAEKQALLGRIESLDAQVLASEAERIAHASPAQSAREDAARLQLLVDAHELERTQSAASMAALAAENAQKEARLTELSAHAAARNAQIAMLESGLSATRGEVVRERDEASQQRMRVLVLENDMRNIYASRSWKLTRFLRTGNQAVRQVARPMLERSLHQIRRHPTLRAALLKTASLVPRLEARVHRFALARPPVAEAARKALSLPEGGQQGPGVSGAAASRGAARFSEAFVPLAGRNGRTLYFYVDHTVHCPVNTGVQRVTRGLSESLLALGESLCFVKWDPDHRRFVLATREDLAHLALWQGPALEADALDRYPPASSAPVPIARESVTQSSWLVMPEVTYINYHRQSLTLEIVLAAQRLGLRTAFTFYDAIPLRRREMTDIAPAHEQYMRALLLADLVIPISKWSGTELAAFLAVHECATPLSRPRIAAIQIPGESRLSERSKSVEPTTRRMLLSVGTMETRKNQLTLIAAFERFVAERSGEGWELVLVGNIHSDVASMLEAARSRQPAIKVAGNISDSDLREYYAQCAFTVFPSVDEGFGLPILESLWHGKPCICANFGAMGEIGSGGGCLLVDTRDITALYGAIEKLADDPVEYGRLRDEALARELLTWPDYATAVIRELDDTQHAVHDVGTIYYCIDHTCTFPYNTGIQRVVRGLGRALIESGLTVVPVKWDPVAQRIHAPSLPELEHLEKWNGPAKWGWSHVEVPASFGPTDWLLMPELTAYPGGPDLRAIKAYSTAHHLRTAWIFYDTIPWKMREIYSETVSGLHRAYLERLNDFELVLAISKFSRDDLIDFLGAQSFRTIGLEQRVVACPLPGEFRESNRITHVKESSGDAIVVLSVGSVEIRKNHLRLLDAFEKVSARVGRPMRLELVGGCHLPAELEHDFRRRLASMPNVAWTESADDASLRARYAECDFTVYPSIEEGFGLPILESLWNARPCICRNVGAMAEVAEGGGCIAVETKDVDALAAAIERLATNDAVRMALANEAIERPFKTWREYGRDVVSALAGERFVQGPPPVDSALVLADHCNEMVNLAPQPVLSICITTYNRAPWLATSLRNLARLIPVPRADVEIVVCDNTSTDATPEVVKPYLDRADFHYHRNAENVGMLGNLSVTASHARGRHVWVLGDDDLLKTGSIERVLDVLKEHPDLALVYLNYAYTLEDKAEKAEDLEVFLSQGTPIVPPGPDIFAAIRSIAPKSENFFTAIYCLVFRRDHALRAYAQDTSGRPFSSMLTCIPTTHHVLHHMMEEQACWIGEPQLVVNMNVSWIRYAPVWILERLPEMFDLAERMGADPLEVDRWRLHSLTNVFKYFEEIFTNDPIGNAELFSAYRLVTRYKHLEPFRSNTAFLRRIYEEARLRGAVGTEMPADSVFKALETELVAA